MTGLKSAFARIHNINADPELKFAAAMVAAAAEDARHGDCQAYEWLTSPCSLRWLVAVVPSNGDCEQIRAMLLQTIPAPMCDADCLGAETFQPSETPLPVVQLAIPGQEVPHNHGDRLQEVRPRAPTIRL